MLPLCTVRVCECVCISEYLCCFACDVCFMCAFVYQLHCGDKEGV